MEKSFVCRCHAYAFPHRQGSGKCKKGTSEDRKCSECRYLSSHADPYGISVSLHIYSECTLSECAY